MTNENTVAVTFGVNTINIEGERLGATIAELISSTPVQASFQCGDGVSAIVNGNAVANDFRIVNGDDVKLVTKAHDKG